MRLANGWSSYDNVQGLLEGFRMGKHFRQPAGLWQRFFVDKLVLGKCILEIIFNCDGFLNRNVL
jgi:hypothetical protein